MPRASKKLKISIPGRNDIIVEQSDDEMSDTESVIEITKGTQSVCTHIPFEDATKTDAFSETCQGCKFGFGPSSTGVMKTLWSIFEKNRNMDEHHLAVLISDAFEKLIVEPSLASNNGEVIESWNEKTVIKHIRDHIVDDTFIVYSNLKILRSLQNSSLGQVHLSDGRIDYRAIASVLNIQKQQQSWLSKLESQL